MITIKTIPFKNVVDYDGVNYVPIKLEIGKLYYFLDHDNKWKMLTEYSEVFSVPLLPMLNIIQFDEHDGRPDEVIILIVPSSYCSLFGVIINYAVIPAES